MFSKTINNNPGGSARGMGGNAANGNNSAFQRRASTNHAFNSLANGSALAAQGLLAAASGQAQLPQSQRAMPSIIQQNSMLAAHQQNQMIANHQNRLLQMQKNELEVQQMASNITETLLIKQRLESIQHQQREANQIRELQLKAVAQHASSSGANTGSGNYGLVSGATTKTIPSTTNSSVLPNKQREDEMTKPDLSTLAETAVAVASATNAANGHDSANGTSMMGIDSIIKLNNNNNSTGDNQIAALLGRQASSATTKRRLSSTGTLLPSMPTPSMTDVLRRDLNAATRDKLYRESNNPYKRSLDELTKGSIKSSTSSSSSGLWNSAAAGNTLGNSNPGSIEQIRAAQHQHLERRHSLPSQSLKSIATAELASLRSFKRQRLLEQNSVGDNGGLDFHDAMQKIRQLDRNNRNMRLAGNNTAFLAEMASKMANANNPYAAAASSPSTISLERRSVSLGSNIGCVGTPSSLSTHLSASAAIGRSDPILSNKSPEMVLNKLSQMGGGFPLPKFLKKSPANRGRKITPELGNNVNDFVETDRRKQVQNDQQSIFLERIGGFPMPALYRHNNSKRNSDEIHGGNSSGKNDTRKESSSTRSNNAISSHIRNTVNRTSIKASRPPALERYQQAWRNIRVVTGDDPSVDERLRKEVFARRLQRGEIFNTLQNRKPQAYLPQRRHSGMSHSSGSGRGNSNNSSGPVSNCDLEKDDILI